MQLPFADEPVTPLNAYIVWNNPTGVQKLLYSKGYPEMKSLPDMYALVNKLIKMDPGFETEFLAQHPDKDMLLTKFTKKHSGLCKLCKSNYTGDEIDDFRSQMTSLPKDQLYQELNLLTQASQSGDVSDQDKANIAQRVDVIGGLLRLSSAQIIQAGGTGNINYGVAGQSAMPTTSTIQQVGSSTTKSQPGFSLQNLSSTQRAIGFLAVGTILGITLITVFKAA